MNKAKTAKKLLSAVMAVIMALGITTALSVPTKAVYNGSCGDNLKWELSDDGVLTINGSGKMYDYDYSPVYGDEDVLVSPFQNRNDIYQIKIDEGVKTIGSWAFEGCSSLKKVSIPNGITSIGDYAFSYCRSLASVNLPEGLTRIGRRSFRDCDSLSKINIPKSVKTIGSAFEYCTALKQMNIHENVVRIEEGFLGGCKSLSKITVSNGNKKYYSEGNCLIERKAKKLLAGCSNSIIPDNGSVKTIGFCAFEDAVKLKSIVIPKGVKTIDIAAFSGCKSLRKICLPSSLKEIGQGAFSDCSSLQSVVIPNGISELGIYTFSDCKSLKKISLPKSIVLIDTYAFDGCESLSDVCYGGTKKDWKAITIEKYQNGSLLKAPRHDLCCETKGHVFETVKAKASFTNDGKIIKTCLVCGHKEKRIIHKASNILLSTTSFVYNGKVQKPKLIIKDSAGKTISAKYYAAKWSNARSKDEGKYTVTVSFKGNYSGKKTLVYKIVSG